MTELAEHGTPPLTGVKAAFDPTVQRTTGTTAHGSIPFDAPVISEVAPNLWRGGCQRGLILPRFFRHLVSLYSLESYKVKHDLVSTLSVRMLDSTDQDTGQVDEIARWVNSCRKTGPTLIHCQAGLNRSGMVVARALMLEGRTADEAITLIREKRSPAALCNPAFEEWLLEFDEAAAAGAVKVTAETPVDELLGVPRSGPGGDIVTTRIRNILTRAGIRTVADLTAMCELDLLDLRNLGPFSVERIKSLLPDGLALAPNPAAGGGAR